MNPLRIEHMTVLDVEPAEVVSIAAELDVPYVSLFVTEGIEGARPLTPADERDISRRLDSTGVELDTVEAFMLQPDVRLIEADVARAARLGARAIVALNVMTPDEGEAAAQLAAHCELAATYGLEVTLEPISMGVTRTPADGVRLIRRTAAANLRLTLDLLHVIRTGSPLAELAAIDPVLIGAQICDGPLEPHPDLRNDEAAYERAIPGTGEFPVAEFLRALPDSAVVGIEVPLRALRLQGHSALERTRLVVDATRKLQADAG